LVSEHHPTLCVSVKQLVALGSISNVRSAISTKRRPRSWRWRRIASPTTALTPRRSRGGSLIPRRQLTDRGAIGFVASGPATYGHGMAAPDTLAISPPVLEHLRHQGVDVPDVGDELTTAEYFAFWREVAARADRPELGLELGAAVFGRSLASEAALQAPTLGEAFRAIGRYKRLVCPEEVIVELRAGEASVRCDWILATDDVPALLVDAIFASYVQLAAHATGARAAPLRIELSRQRRHGPVLRAHFGCPIVFGATHDRIVFSASALALPLVTANREAYQRLLPGLEAKLAGRRSLVGEVRIAIARTISAGLRPSVETIAGRLDTSPRTLQRRLSQVRTTFQDQLDDVRHVAARRLLEATELAPIDIAFLLGFAEPNSFARAFRLWERTTPLRWRAARS
jgi:AraC-like DNA-binding protein